MRLIDLHTHTDESDGSFSPAELVEGAVRAGVAVLGVTDHDTFAGYDKAVPLARAAGLDLVRGIELSTKLHGRSVHLLGYFPAASELEGFRNWVLDLQASRRERNGRLAERLRELGFDIRQRHIASNSNIQSLAYLRDVEVEVHHHGVEAVLTILEK